MIYVRIYETENGSMIAMCDEELIGKVYREANVELDLDRYADFYRGKLLDEERARGMIAAEELYTANIVGDDSVGLFLKQGLVSKSDIKRVQGVPFVHIYKTE